VRNEEAAELGARARFAIAEVQAGIDQIFTDLLEREPGRAETRWPALWERAQAAKGWHQWLMVGRLTEARAEIALAKGDLEGAAEAAHTAIGEATSVSRRKYETAARLVLGRALLGLKEPPGLRRSSGRPWPWRSASAIRPRCRGHGGTWDRTCGRDG
jgi:hypothetical protein